MKSNASIRDIAQINSYVIRLQKCRSYKIKSQLFKLLIRNQNEIRLMFLYKTIIIYNTYFLGKYILRFLKNRLDLIWPTILFKYKYDLVYGQLF